MSLKQHTWISAFGNAEIELDQFLLSLSAFGDSGSFMDIFSFH